MKNLKLCLVMGLLLSFLFSAQGQFLNYYFLLAENTNPTKYQTLKTLDTTKSDGHVKKIGEIVAVIPVESQMIELGMELYFYHDGCFFLFDKAKDQFKIVSAPWGAIINILPKEHRIEHIHGKQYFVCGNTWYKAVKGQNGATKYKVTRVS